MLYWLGMHFSDAGAFSNVVRYITVRSFIAFIIGIILSLVIGRWFIALMKRIQFQQAIRSDGPKSHLKKQGTPTLGGVFIVAGIMGAVAVAGRWSAPPLLITLGVFLSFFCLGLLDDYLKVIKRDPKGVSARMKLVWQFATAGVASWALVHWGVIDTGLYVPFFKNPIADLRGWYILFASIVIVGSSNAVNITDGLDGLAIGPIMTSGATLALLAYLAGHRELSTYLLIPYIQGAGELAVLLAATVGASAGFLWFNSHPAQIFMGDVGSLSLGGLLGTVAVLTKNEVLFVCIGGIFVVEALSVILQVGSYKLRKKRIFKMAPIHHHFELAGWAENKVIVRFWIISLVLAILSIATIKLR